MTVRPLKDSDLPILRSLIAPGLPYPPLNGPQVESVHVVANEQDKPIMAFISQRIIEGYLVADPMLHPAAKVHALRLLHDIVAPELKARGWDDCTAFLPPTLAAKFGRRLERTFGWVKNWPSWAKRL
jgi:hypothetical protein